MDPDGGGFPAPSVPNPIHQPSRLSAHPLVGAGLPCIFHGSRAACGFSTGPRLQTSSAVDSWTPSGISTSLGSTVKLRRRELNPQDPGYEPGRRPSTLRRTGGPFLPCVFAPNVTPRSSAGLENSRLRLYDQGSPPELTAGPNNGPGSRTQYLRLQSPARNPYTCPLYGGMTVPHEPLRESAQEYTWHTLFERR